MNYCAIGNTSLPRNVKVKLKVNSLSILSESENGILLFIPFSLLPQGNGGIYSLVHTGTTL